MLVNREDLEMSNSATCTDCGARAPETNIEDTLISKSFGWRLSREELGNGERTMAWRCPTCWRKHKMRARATMTEHVDAKGIAPSAAPASVLKKRASSRSSAPPPAR
jgi:DNA-directed RNA polymerase subunit RPC12/RpoP